ncbi:hypothetical protein Y032_0328g2641 [Ancylostoma ceylanicum]|nr:hypothetical protein Y032_0328g2641 [Ancylostoma ceylanicum]
MGPLLVRSERTQERKVWVCLFTCMTTRAVHLEAVIDNSTAQFLLAFRRFIARRGAPELVLSDNAPTFKLGREVLTNELVKMKDEEIIHNFTTEHNFRWNFITPLSPWKGGFYERLVGSVKTALKKTIPRQILDLPKLQTLICEVEAVLNTRPITSVPTNTAEEAYVLRPIDLISPYFRLGQLNGPVGTRAFYNESNETDSQASITLYYTVLRESLDAFWNIWRKEYLQLLGEKNILLPNKKQGARKGPSVGDVVLMKQENTPRSRWPLGLVIGLNKSTDGAYRSAQVRTSKNTILDRSINQLLPLEITAATEETAKGTSTGPTPSRIQPTRAAKQKRANRN